MVFVSRFFYPLLFFVMLAFVNAVGFNGLYGQDAYEYFRYSKALHHFFITGKNPGDFFWSFMYPLTGSLLSFVFSPVFSLQLVSMLSFLFTFYFTEKILLHFYSDKKNAIRFYLLLFWFLSPFSLRSAVTCMSDMLCLNFIMGSLYFLVKLSAGKINSFLYFVLFACLACITRYAAAVILLFPFFYAVKIFAGRFNFRILLLSLITAAVILIPLVVIKSGNVHSLLPHYFIFEWNVANLFKSEFLTADGLQTYTLPNIVYCFSNLYSPGYFFAGLIVLFFTRKIFFKEPFIKIVLLSWYSYAFFVGCIPFQNNRVLLLSFPLVLVFLFPAAQLSWKYISEKFTNKKVVLITVAMLQLVLFTRAFIPFYHYNANEQKIISFIQSVPHTTVYTTEMTAALNAFDVKHTVIDLWNESINKINKPALLLVNLPKFEKQYENMNVMSNYNIIRNKTQITLVKNFDSGWQLYEIR